MGQGKLGAPLGAPCLPQMGSPLRGRDACSPRAVPEPGPARRRPLSRAVGSGLVPGAWPWAVSVPIATCRGHGRTVCVTCDRWPGSAPRLCNHCVCCLHRVSNKFMTASTFFLPVPRGLYFTGAGVCSARGWAA